LFREYKKAVKEADDLEVELSQKHDKEFLELIEKSFMNWSAKKRL